MGREIRRVPENWEHPKNKEGEYIPMCNFSFQDVYEDWELELKKWYEGNEKFKEGLTYCYTKKKYTKNEDEEYETFEEYAGEPPSPPNPNDYMPTGKWYQLYEDVSEGTPLSPAFSSKKELINWLSENNDYWGTFWGREAAKNIVETGFALSGILSNGKMYKPEDQHLL